MKMINLLSVKTKIMNILPDPIALFLKKNKGVILRLYKPFVSLVFKKPYYQYRKLKYHSIELMISKKDRIRAAFLMIHASNWKYDEVYKQLALNTIFEPVVIICPIITQGESVMTKEMEYAEELCRKSHYNYIKSWDSVNRQWIDIKQTVKPDIVFICNPHKLTRDEYYFTNFLDTLLCYVPYSIRTDHLIELGFNEPLQNMVWRNYYESKIHFDIARQYAINKGANVVVTGYPTIDSLIKNDLNDSVWKKQDHPKKRIIWAPHWTIPGASAILQRSCFLDYCDFFLQIADQYEQELQISFKPHPFLKQTLSQDRYWGKDKTDLYYQKWDSLSNGQVNDAEYNDLFKTSDALIHDSVSFLSEYLALNKPVMFTKNGDDIEKTFNDFGRLAFDCHYPAATSEDIKRFIEKVVLMNEDTMLKQRSTFIKEYLVLSKDGAAKSIVNNILMSLRR